MIVGRITCRKYNKTHLRVAAVLIGQTGKTGYLYIMLNSKSFHPRSLFSLHFLYMVFIIYTEPPDNKIRTLYTLSGQHKPSATLQNKQRFFPRAA